MKGRPETGGLNDPRGAAANDADDSTLADAAVAAVLVHGLKPAHVVLANHDPRWARRFTARATELRRVLGERARLVEHVGSTAVPDLAANPWWTSSSVSTTPTTRPHTCPIWRRRATT